MSASKIDPRGQSRRSFISLVGIAGAAALLGARPGTAPAQAAQLPHLTEADPTAKALGYTEDAGKVDKSKFPTYKAGAHCATCNFFQGAAGQAYGPCQLFPGKAVNAHGWCASHTPKA